MRHTLRIDYDLYECSGCGESWTLEEEWDALAHETEENMLTELDEDDLDW